MLFRSDPDIPPRNQRVLFSVSGLSEQWKGNLSWRVDGGELWSGDEVFWPPLPGRHRVELLAKGGEVLDTVTLTVRGTVLTAPVSNDDYLVCAEDATLSC